MIPRLPPTATRWIKIVAIPLVAVVFGVAIALASSPSSLSRGQQALGTPVPASPTPTPVTSTPVPSVTEAGVLGKAPELIAAGAQSIVGKAPTKTVGSADGGKTWISLGPPANASGIAVDPGNPQRLITGGPSIRFTTDGGATWRPALAAPPAGGPFQVLGVSPFDGNVWFYIHQAKLLRTRDASASWRDIAGLPAMSNPVITAGPVFAELFLATGNRVFHLVDNGQQISELPALPSGVNVVTLAATGGGPASLVARGASGGLYTLQGAQWLVANGAPAGPTAAGANGVVLVGDGSGQLGAPGSISYSVDAGATWHQAAGLPYDQSVEAVAGQPTSVIFVAYSYGGDIYKSSDGGGTWTLLSRALRTTTG